MFQFPSTPDSQRQYKDDDNPSTTPAGPPPTGYTAQSFTPTGQPPAPVSVFGSSFGANNLTNAKPAFGPSGHLNSPPINRPLHTDPFGSKKGFFVPDSSPPRDYGDYDEEDYMEDTEGEDMDEGDLQFNQAPQQRQNGFMTDTMAIVPSLTDSPRGAKRARNGDIMAASMRSSRIGRPHAGRVSDMPGIAKGLASTMPAKTILEETDDVILNTESTLAHVDSALKTLPHDEAEYTIAQASQRLVEEWSKYTNKESLSAAIGPVQKSGLTRAEYIASLLFQLHHPASIQQSSNTRSGLFGRSTRSLISNSSSSVPVPRALMDWLNAHHNPYPEDLPEVMQCKPSPTAHERFWDTVFSTMLRGNMTLTVQLLQNANFAHADTSIEDGYDEPGYKGRQLTAVQYVVGQCANLLKTCPAFTDDNWDIRDTEWAIFRTRVRRTLEDLESYAEEGNTDRDSVAGNTNVFQTTRLGTSFSAASRRAESKVPWTIYEQLKTIYGQLLGLREEILLCAQDWLEAVIYLTAWWDGEDEDSVKGGLPSGRRSLRHMQHVREVDISPILAYKRRLLAAFASVTDDPEDAVLGVNTADPVQVALACLFEDDIEGAVKLLQGWSMPVAVAVVDIASAAGWLPDSRPRSGNVMDGFDQSDLMVLSHGQSQKNGLDRDQVLIDYADVLAKRDKVKSSDGRTSSEGWEMAVRIISRLDSTEQAQAKIASIFDAMAFDSTQQVDKALAVCNELGLAGQVRSISEKYANSLAESTHSYGEAIIYYARARSIQQLRSTLDLLISMSLVQSAAYPPETELDDQLHLLLNDQRHTLSDLARVDIEAAQLIATHLSGYATLRRFYDLRDENEDDEEGRKSGLRPLARKREAAKAVVALIESAADTIRGGLYDSDVAAVVQVDTLLTLLGETLPLMEQTKPLLKQAQLISLLRAAEDLETVSSRIYEQAETLFQAAMSDLNGMHVTSPQDLSKSLSGSGFAMVNSNGSLESEGRTNGTREEVHRAWDWRKGLATVSGKSAKGSDVLRIMRIQVAKEMARAWTESQ